MSDAMLAFTNAKPGYEAQFNEWYGQEHLPAVIAVDGVLGGSRLEAAQDLPGDLAHPYRYLAIYDVESGGCQSVVDGLMQSGISLSDHVEEPALAWFFEELAPRRARPDAGDGPFDRLVVLTNAAPGGDEAFNRWYDGRHVSDVIDVIGGFVAAQRFRRADVRFNRTCPWGYLAIYDIPKGEMEHALERIGWSRAEREEAHDAGREPAVPIDPAMEEERMSWWYRETVPYVAAGQTAAA
jgi:hypothetical protein